MRKVQRGVLPAPEQKYLALRTTAIQGANDPKSFAGKAWDNKNRNHFDVIRAQLKAMAAGRSNCMYCDDSVGTDIDHFEPRAHDYARTFDWDNYLLACSHCNSNAKRDNYPLDSHGQPLLIDPSVEDPDDHLALHPATGKYLTDSPKGLASIEVFDLNREILKRRRIDAWRGVAALIRDYVRLLDKGRTQAARLTLGTLHRHPFAEVLSTMKSSAHAQAGQIGDDLEAAILAHPEI